MPRKYAKPRPIAAVVVSIGEKAIKITMQPGLSPAFRKGCLEHLVFAAKEIQRRRRRKT